MTTEPMRFIPQDYEPFVEFDRLTPHPANPNEGDIGLLSELLAANGFGGAILAQKETGIIIDGEHRMKGAQARGATGAPVIWLHVTDDERDTLLAEWNESTRRGRNDEAKLLALLQGIALRPAGLVGTGFDGDDVDSLLAKLNKPLILGDAPSGGGYAETPEQMRDRQEQVGQYADRKGGGALVEMILVFTVEDRTVVGQILEAARAALGNPDARAAEMVLKALYSWQQAGFPAGPEPADG